MAAPSYDKEISTVPVSSMIMNSTEIIKRFLSKNIPLVLIALLTIGMFSSHSLAQSPMTIMATVQDSGSNPLGDVLAELVDPGSGSVLDFTYSFSDGTIVFSSVAEGTYKLDIKPQSSYCGKCAALKDKSFSFTASTLDSMYNSGTNTQTLTNKTLSFVNRYIAVNVTDDSNSPVFGLYVNIFEDYPGDGYYFGTTDENGQFFVGIPTNSTSTYSVNTYSYDQSYSDASKSFVSPNTSGATPVNLSVAASNATVNFSVKSGGSTLNLSSLDYVSINCYSETQGYYASISGPGSATGSFSVISTNSGITLTCSAYLEDFGAMPVNLTIKKGETKSLTLPVFARDSVVDVTFRDKSGNLIDPAELGFLNIFASTPYASETSFQDFVLVLV
ncbi:MAG: hypothetical protein KDD53_10735, partial [Bdellovibrionales bacterium]|nr:hypothetical protein [Bdellovibrionales bacterium]